MSLQYNDLMKKKRIVTNDKSKILSTIEELDKKKNDALNVAWKQVNNGLYLLVLGFEHGCECTILYNGHSEKP